jgi:uncharacterized membrane protein
LAFLGIVSFWRVALMIRVLQVLCKTPVWVASLWVLTAALGEVLAVAGMGGMRNSLEEEEVLSVLGTAFMVSLWGFPILAVASAVLSSQFDMRCQLADLPPRNEDRVRWRWLLVVALFWIAVAVYPQQQVRLNAEVDRRVEAEDYCGAIEFLSIHTPDEFAPARQLPPKPFEHEIFEQLPRFFDQLSPEHPAWVRAHFMQRLDEFSTHFQPRREGAESNRIQRIANRISWLGQKNSPRFKLLFEGMARLPEGREWVRTNNSFVPGLQSYVAELEGRTNKASLPTLQVRNAWRAVTQTIDRIKESSE